MNWVGARVLGLTMLLACSPSKPTTVTPGADLRAAPPGPTDGGAPSATEIASVPPADAGAPSADATSVAAPGKPFANNAAEATSLINDAVDAQANGLGRCVETARARSRKMHGKISVEIGIDQEGKLIGVKTPKGQKEDRGFNDCVRGALTGANFPRSHAGVITLRRSFEDQAVYR